MEKRTIIALALSFLVIGTYPMILQKFYPDYYKQRSAAQQKTASSSKEALSAPSVSEKWVKPGVFTPDDDVPFSSAGVSMVLSKKDGGIREIDFPRFTDSETQRPIRFTSLKNAGSSTAAILLNTSAGSAIVTDHDLRVAASSLESDARAAGLRVKRHIRFDQDYSADYTLVFENTTGGEVRFSYEVLAGSGVIPRHSIDMQYVESNFCTITDGKAKLKHTKEARSGKIVRSEKAVDWIAIKDRHFSVILKPKTQGAAFSAVHRGLGAHDFSASLVSEEEVLPAGGKLTREFVMYIGPNELEYLLPLGLGDLVNFGKFDWIGKLCVGALEIIQGAIKNYGLTVIALTALINLILFPMTRVSYMSMKRMQLIQPQVNKLREQNKKNPEKLNREMMELYRKHKVNPFGGCLPMVLQIPIFISLYVALSKYVPLVNAKFLWVKDLSSPDRVYLPVTLPVVGNSIHLLPLLMCAAMVIQQRFTQIRVENQDPQMEAQQKMMAVMMPVVFLFIFYQMPASLVLYWLTNTVLMSLYQLRLKKMTLS